MDHMRSTGIHSRVVAPLAALLALSLAFPLTAFADADGDAEAAVTAAKDSIRRRKHDEAVEVLKQAENKCRSEGCADNVVAEVYLHQGLAFASMGEADKAQERFEWALGKNSSAEPDERYVTRKVKAPWSKAQANVAAGSGAQPPAPPGAVTTEQDTMLTTAKEFRDSGEWEECVAVLVGMPPFPDGKLVLAQCYAIGELYIEAKREAETAHDMAKADKNDTLVTKIETYLEEVEVQLPKIKLLGINKVGIKSPVVKVDNKEVPEEKIGDPIPHNPGEASIDIGGDRGCHKFRYSTSVKFEKNETLEFDLSIQEDLKSPFELCTEDARTPREEQQCRIKCGVPDEDLNFRAGLEVASYNDNDNVDVLSPSIYLAAVHPTQGWNVGGHAIVDVVTTASADIVATASRRFDDVRFGGSLGGGYKVGPVTAGVSAAVSLESDYIGRTVGGSLSTDLFDKMVSPFVSYGFGFDILGRADTEFEIFRRDLQRHTINAGTSVVFSPSTVGVIGATVQVEKGDSSKPYRHVAMFPGNLVGNLPQGAAPALVATLRADAMPLEQLPTDRLRYAVLLRGMHRLDESTIRGDERLYMDSWGQMASTTDLRYFLDFTEKVRFGGHLRFHFQGPADFWQFAYVADPLPNGSLVLPEIRTGDRELGPLLAATLGALGRYQLTENFALQIEAQGIYTRFLDHLYIVDRWGVFTATTAEIEIQ